MLKFRYITFFLVTFVALVQPLSAQVREVLVPIEVPQRQNIATAKLKSLLKGGALATAKLDTLNLPFFDDFSKQTNGIPDPAKWTNRNVFVNNSYPINQPTMGVATFDIADENGFIYKHANSTGFPADTLTSMPIGLKTTDGGVFLSFSYQPKGNGDMPERRDSLTLHFYSPADSAWVSMWSAYTDTVNGSIKPNVLSEMHYWEEAPIQVYNRQAHTGSIDSSFYKVMIPIADTCYLKPGFRFMFVNYASRSKDETSGKQSDCDMWNVDMVYLNKNRIATDTVAIDVAIQTPILRMLKGYTSMPWQHLKKSTTAQREQLVNAAGTGVTVFPVVANLYNDENAFAAEFEIACVKGAQTPTSKKISGGNTALDASEKRVINFNFLTNDILNVPLTTADSVAFDVKLVIWDYIVGPADMEGAYRSNDTCVFRQNFFTYYAYDDGTAENGYGAFGNQADRAKVAVQYNSYLRDTLSGVYIYFNNTLDSGNVQPFRLTVWNDKRGVPGDTLYQQANCYSRFDSLNKYVYYKLNRPVVIDEGATFYVGWVQQSTAMLNVGFDNNNPISGKNFVSTDGYTWDPSKFDGQGAIMIRPSFAKEKFDVPTSVVTPRANLVSVTVYPNPVSDDLYLELPDELREKTLRVEIFNLGGQCVMQSDIEGGVSINVSALVQGTYFIRFIHGSKPVGYAKFVKR